MKIWDADGGELMHTLEGHTEGISDVAWSVDGEFLASASDDKTVRIWSLELVRTFSLLVRGDAVRISSPDSFHPGDNRQGSKRSYQLCVLRELQSSVQSPCLRRV